jgi:N utilization substance protein A
MAVWSEDPDVDPVGACVGVNGDRVNNVVDELQGEKIDIVEWSETPAVLIEHALSPAKVIAVLADSDDKTAQVIVPDYQLSLAIGREGQNARLAARLTGYKIDIKSESQARDDAEWMEAFGIGEDYEEYDDEYFDDDENYDESYDDDELYDEDYEEDSDNVDVE